MKKLVLILALAIGVPVVSTTTSVLVAQTCDPDSPCLYTGSAYSSSGKNSVVITVKMDKNGNWVAEVVHKGTYYVFESRSAADQEYGNYYVSVDGTKYYFNM